MTHWHATTLLLSWKTNHKIFANNLVRRNSAYCQQNPEDEGWQSQTWLNEARRRNWKRILFLVPGKTWNLCDPHSGSNTKTSISDLSYEQKTVSRELDEHGVTEDYVDRYLIRKQKDQGCVKACGTHRLQKSIKDKLHLPDSHKQAGRKWAVQGQHTL